jgi:hypothetical protein
MPNYVSTDATSVFVLSGYMRVSGYRRKEYREMVWKLSAVKDIHGPATGIVITARLVTSNTFLLSLTIGAWYYLS